VHGYLYAMQEYIAIADTQTCSSYARMYEAVAAADTTTTKIKLYPTLEEAITVGEDVGIEFTIPTMNEAVTCTSLFNQTRTIFVTEAIVADGPFVSSSHLKYAMSDVVTANDVYGPAYYRAITESVAATDTYVGKRLIVALVQESVNAAETLPNSYTKVVLAINESVDAADVTTNKATLNAAVAEIVGIAQSYWYRDTTQIAWQMNTETTAVNWNTNYMFDSIAQFGNTVLATAPDGVYLLSGDTDAAVAIPAKVQTGFMDFDDRKVKRMDGVYFGLQGSELKLSVEIFGGTGPSTYTMPAKTTTTPGSNRIIPGKGLASRYWKMTFENVNGGDFDIDNIELDVVSSTTRRM